MPVTLGNFSLAIFLIAWISFGWFLVVSPHTMQRWAVKYAGRERIQFLRPLSAWARRFVASDAYLVQTRVIGVLMCLVGLFLLIEMAMGHLHLR